MWHYHTDKSKQVLQTDKPQKCITANLIKGVLSAKVDKGMCCKHVGCKFDPCRVVARLATPGGQERNISLFFLIVLLFSLIFPQFSLFFFINLVLRVGGSPTREGPGYATAHLVSIIYFLGKVWYTNGSIFSKLYLVNVVIFTKKNKIK